MGANIILNSRYFRVAQAGEQPKDKKILTKSQTADLVHYVGTRESVSLNNNDTSLMIGESTDRQKETLQALMNQCKDYENTHEYKDYIANPTKANASELITRLSEMILLDNGIYLDEAVSDLVSYVGTRPSVDIEKSQQHGLFSSEDNVDLEKAMEELSNHKGRIWTHVISLRREDADRLGYSSQAPWKQLVRSEIDTIAKANNIKLENLRWYAGMHNTGHHPHIHLFIYSNDPKEGYINADGIKKIKSKFANEIFKDDLKHSFVNQTEYRNQIKDEMSQLVDKINQNPLSQYDNATLDYLQNSMYTLANKMPDTGKYYYKYQPKEVKELVDDILKALTEKSPDMSRLYDMWCIEQEKILGTYNESPEYKTPIEQNDNFKFLKNSLLKKARELQAEISDKDTYEINKDIQADIVIDYEIEETNISNNIDDDFEIEETISDNDQPDFKENIDDTLDEVTDEQLSDDKNADFTADKELLMPDFLLADDFAKLEHNALSDPKASYELGLQYLYGNSKHNIQKNYELAQRYLVISANQNNAYANYELGKIYYNGVGVEADTEISNNYFLKAHDLLLSELPNEMFESFNYNIPIPNIDYDTCKVLYTLGTMYYKGLGVPQDYQKAEMYFSASQEKIPYSKIYLGNISMYGLGKDIDYERAKEYYTEAMTSRSEFTQAQASYKIALMYEKGLGTNVDYELAFRNYFNSATKADLADAHYKMGQLLETEKFKTNDIGKEQANGCYQKALELYLKAEKEMENKSTELTIGTMYAKGQGVAQNEDKAVEWLTKSAKKDNAIAYQKLGAIYADENSKYFDINKAVKCLEQSAKIGNHFANYQLGKIYSDPNGKFYDLNKAISNLQISAEQGNHFANYKLGKIYADKDSQFYDLNKAIPNLQISAEQGNHFANYTLGKIYADKDSQFYDLNKAISNLQMSAEQGNHFANYQLGKIYADKDSQFYDLNKAISNLHISAQQGNHFANYKLGEIYADKDSQFYDLNKAISNLQISAEQGNHFANYTLGKIYADKDSQFYDLNKAIPNLQMSANQGNHFADYKLGKIFADKNSEFYNPDKAMEHLYISSAHSNHLANYQIGRLCISRDSPYFDVQNAISNFEISAKENNPNAYYQLGKIYSSRSFGVYDREKAIFCFKKAHEGNHPFAKEQLDKLQNPRKPHPNVGRFLSEIGNCLSGLCRLVSMSIDNDMSERINNYNRIDSKAQKKRKKHKAKHSHTIKENNSNNFNMY
ncbi:MAG: MobP3 family relaxase [Acutalibacteraceae bacterium]|nr:MobP3 family relaxase [Acutalibacteraceae bacterium]